MSDKNFNIKLQDNNEMPVLGLGTWRLSGRECISIVQKALEFGYTHFDTAQMYGNESEIGKAIKGFEREKLFITSKVWYDQLSYKNLIYACENSIKSLNTSYLDLYLVHWPNSRIPMKETFSAMSDLIERGLVKSVGVSNFTISHIENALKVSSVSIVTNQVEFHPYLYQKELLEYCTKHKIILTAWAPLARGLIFNDSTLKRIANAHKKTIAQITLRWLIQKNLIVIPKASSEKHLQENISIFDFSLSKDEIAEIYKIPTERRLIDLSFSQ